MSSKRAKNHKNMVAFEKKYHHLAGTRLHQHYKTRWINLLHAMSAELPDDCRFYSGRFWKCPECGAVNVSEENVVDWTVKKCRRCQKMIVIVNFSYRLWGLNYD